MRDFHVACQVAEITNLKEDKIVDIRHTVLCPRRWGVGGQVPLPHYTAGAVVTS